MAYFPTNLTNWSVIVVPPFASGFATSIGIGIGASPIIFVVAILRIKAIASKPLKLISVSSSKISSRSSKIGSRGIYIQILKTQNLF